MKKSELVSILQKEIEITGDEELMNYKEYRDFLLNERNKVK